MTMKIVVIALSSLLFFYAATTCGASTLENRNLFVWANVDSQNASFGAFVSLTELAEIFLENNKRSGWYQDSDKVLHSPPHAPQGNALRTYYVHKVTAAKNRLGVVEVFENGIRVCADDEIFMSARIPDDLNNFDIGAYHFESLPIYTAKDVGVK